MLSLSNCRIILLVSIGRLVDTLVRSRAVVLIASSSVDGREIRLNAKDVLQHLDSALSSKEASVDVVNLEILNNSLRVIKLIEEFGQVEFVFSVLIGDFENVVQVKVFQVQPAIGGLNGLSKG